MVTLSTAVALTLVCCPLHASLLLRSQLLLAVVLQSPKGELLACRRLHARQQVGVVDSAMRAVGGEDRGAHVTADLCSAERACLAAACLALRSATVPSQPPAPHSLVSALNCVAARECGEAASGVVWSVLEEDVMLRLGTEVRHGGEEREREA